MAPGQGRTMKGHVIYGAEKKMAAINPIVWDVLSRYADIRNELDEIIISFNGIYTEAMDALTNLSSELLEVALQLRECDSVLRIYKVPPDGEYAESGIKDGLPDEAPF